MNVAFFVFPFKKDGLPAAELTAVKGSSLFNRKTA